MHRIGANNPDVIEHFPDSHSLNPIGHLGIRLEKECYLLVLEWTTVWLKEMLLGSKFG